MPHRFPRALLAFALFASLSAAAPPTRAQTLEQMAGQMLIVGFAGDDASDPAVKRVRDEVAAGLLGGIMYLKPNVASLDTVRAMNETLRAASPGLLPFLSLDQEGGLVERLTDDIGFTERPRAADVSRARTPGQAEALYRRMAGELASLGFTLNLAPVVDLDLNPKNPVIGRFGRSFGADASTVTAYAAAFVRAHRAAGVLTALKHFPGHGSSSADSHDGFVDITQSWSAAELDPYRSLIDGGLADMVMVGHLYHARFAGGAGRLPATLSRAWIAGVLRGELGYEGVVISDDLEMGAIRKQFTLHDAVVAAVRAGVDVLLFSNTAKYDPDLAAKVRAILVAEAGQDPEFRARIEESYRRIVALKHRIAD